MTFKNFTNTMISLILGFLVGAIILKLSGISPLEAYSVMLQGLYKNPSSMAYVLIRSTPLILTGLSVAFAFRTGLFNIGAEGQFIVGAISAVFLGIKLALPPIIQIPLIILLSAGLAGVYGGLSGFLKSKYGVHEVISTIMLNWIALYLSNYFVMNDFLHRPNTETTEFINPNGSIQLLENWKTSSHGQAVLSHHPFWSDFLRPPVNAGIFFALVAAIIVWFVLEKTTFGQKLKAVGFNPHASEYAGINVRKKMTQSMFISGALAGLAGSLHVLGDSQNVALLAAFEGQGFDGIAVSLIGANHPLAVLFSGFFLGSIKYSGQKLQSALEAPSEIISIMIGSMIFFMAMPQLIEKIAALLFRRKKL